MRESNGLGETHPRVSVVTPTHNRAKLLHETIETVLGQTFADFEYLVVDDGSTEDIGSVVSSFPDRRLSLLRQDNRGESAAVNAGWARARGEYFAVVGSDDPVLPYWLREMVQFLDLRRDLIAAYPDWLMIGADGVTLERMTTYDYTPRRLAGWMHCLPGPGAVIRRSALRDLASIRSEDLVYTSDLDCWLRLSLRGPLGRLPKTLATWRYHSGSASVAVRDTARGDEIMLVASRFFAGKVGPEVARLEMLARSRANMLAAIIGFRSAPLGALNHYLRSVTLMPSEPDDIPPERRRPGLATVALGVVRGALAAPARPFVAPLTDVATRALETRFSWFERTQQSVRYLTPPANRTEAPIVSVIIPTRDRAIPVMHALRSALAQSIADIEVIVIDDGSIDGTADSLRRVQDRRLRIGATAGDGPAAARNAGIALARGRAIAFLDADDLYAPVKLAKSLALLDQGAAFVHGPWVERSARGERTVRPSAVGDARHRLLMFARVATPTVVARTDLVRAAGGFATDLPIAEDGDLWLRLAAMGPVACLSEPLSTVRIGGDGVRRRVDTIYEAHCLIVRRFFATSNAHDLLPQDYYLANAAFIRACSLMRRGAVADILRALVDVGRYFRAAWDVARTGRTIDELG